MILTFNNSLLTNLNKGSTYSITLSILIHINELIDDDKVTELNVTFNNSLLTNLNKGSTYSITLSILIHINELIDDDKVTELNVIRQSLPWE